MKRVVCVSDDSQLWPNLPKVKKGNLYTIVDSHTVTNHQSDGIRAMNGVYYVLLETGGSVCFHESCFIEINEDQKDEADMNREYSLKDRANLSL